jgi:N-methylhydantoinase A
MATAPTPEYQLGVDIGGTFTDSVILDRDGTMTVAKASSTPQDFSKGFFHSLEEGAQKLGLDLDALLSNATLAFHGATVATNAIVQRLGARVGLLATRGHSDALVIMRGNGRTAGLTPATLLHASQTNKPELLVPRRLVREIDERIDADGDVIVRLDEDGVRTAVRELVAEGVEALAVCLLWSFKNDVHEQRVKAIIAEEAPDLFVTVSSELAPKLGEYERMAATVMNSYIGPVVARYLRKVNTRVAEHGYSRKLLLMQCSGGVFTETEAVERPILTTASGPVGGVTGSAHLGRIMGRDHVIATDMGGTSFDVGLVRDGLPMSTPISIVDQYEYYVPMVDVRSIGSGGGSIVWVDPVQNALKVGPQSAGAEPGPVCYGRGGVLATVTDCDVILGRLNPQNFLGGRMTLDAEGSRRAMQPIADALGLSAEEAAAGAVTIVENAMHDLIRQTTVESGYDPRDFTMFAYGGAGPVHVGGYAKGLGMLEAVVPLGDIASTWSALGVASADILHVLDRTAVTRAPFDGELLRSVYAELEAEADALLDDEDIPPERRYVRRLAELRYTAQIFEIEIPLPDGDLDEEALAGLLGEFERRYEELYGSGTAFSAAGVELVTARVRAIGRIPRPTIAAHDAVGDAADAQVEPREVYWPGAGWQTTTVYRGERLPPGAALDGPAVVEMPDTTIVVHPDQRGRMDELGNFVLTL